MPRISIGANNGRHAAAAMDVGCLERARSEHASATTRDDRADALACVAPVRERVYRDAGPQVRVAPRIDALDAQIERGYPELDAATADLAGAQAAGYRDCDPWWNRAAMAEVAARARERNRQPECVVPLVGGHVGK